MQEKRIEKEERKTVLRKKTKRRKKKRNRKEVNQPTPPHPTMGRKPSSNKEGRGFRKTCEKNLQSSIHLFIHESICKHNEAWLKREVEVATVMAVAVTSVTSAVVIAAAVVVLGTVVNRIGPGGGGAAAAAAEQRRCPRRLARD